MPFNDWLILTNKFNIDNFFCANFIFVYYLTTMINNQILLVNLRLSK